MPRPVVPILPSPAAALAQLVELAVQRQDQRGVLGDAQVAGVDLDALRFAARPISSPSAQGSTTTPLPMTDSLPGRTTPEGSRDELVGLVADHQRVAGVVAALEAHDDVGALATASRRSCPCPRRPTGRRSPPRLPSGIQPLEPPAAARRGRPIWRTYTRCLASAGYRQSSSGGECAQRNPGSCGRRLVSDGLVPDPRASSACRGSTGAGSRRLESSVAVDDLLGRRPGHAVAVLDDLLLVGLELHLPGHHAALVVEVLLGGRRLAESARP